MNIIFVVSLSLAYLNYGSTSYSGLISLAPEFFRAVSAVQSNNTSVADEYIKILLHRLTSNDVTSIAKYAYNDLESGAEDLYNGFTEMQNFANILSSIESMNPEGGLASRLPRSVLETTIQLSEKITGCITGAAFILLNFGVNFKNAIETIKFASSNSDELHVQLKYVNGVDKAIGQLATYSKNLAGYVQTIISCINKIENAVNGTLYFNKNPDRDIRKINNILLNIETDFQQLETSLGNVSQAFKENLQETQNSSTEKIMLTNIIVAFGGPAFQALESAVNLFGSCQDLNRYVNDLVKTFQDDE